MLTTMYHHYLVGIMTWLPGLQCRIVMGAVLYKKMNDGNVTG